MIDTKQVPIEPTEEMIDQIAKEFGLAKRQRPRYRAVYKAMIAAAPAPQAVQPTDIVLGDGKTLVSDIHNADEGWAGICFSTGGQGVGVDTDHPEGTTDNDIEAFARIRADNPESLRVVIAALNRAIARIEPGLPASQPQASPLDALDSHFHKWFEEVGSKLPTGRNTGPIQRDMYMSYQGFFEAVSLLTPEQGELAIKDYCVAFFYWWWNQRGSNTADGFDQWVNEGMPGLKEDTQEGEG